MTHIDEGTLEELRALLEAEKQSLEEELAAHGTNTDGNWQGTSKSEGEEADATDAADNIEELATNVPLVEELERRLTDVRIAIEKMEKGTYGMDENTNEPIAIDRLKANPAARTNIER